MEQPKALTRNPYQVYKGVAAEDLAANSVILKIICPELIPNSTTGTVGAGITTNPISLKDRDGNPISNQITTANHFVATWEGHSVLRYPNRVRKGEPVEIYRVGDQDHYNWRTTGQGRDYRTTDRVHLELAATDPSKPGVAKDDTNTYSAVIDTENKFIEIKTSKANGEVAAFSLKIDTAAGTFHLSDDSAEPGNRIYLDIGKNGSPIFQVNLSSGAAIKLEKDDAFIKVPKKLLISAGERIVLDSPIVVINVSQAGAVIINAASIAFNAAKDIILTAGNVVGINASSSVISGVLVSASARIANAVKGAFKMAYTPVKVQSPQESSVQVQSNSADTDLTGLPYRN